MPDQSDEVMRQGRRRLKALLPALRAQAAREAKLGGPVLEPTTGIGQGMMQFLPSARLDALNIYPGEKGGWIADVVLKGVPQGYGNTFGTPVALPHPTREAAEAEGRRLVINVLKEQARLAASPPPAVDPAFVLHGVQVTLPRRFFDTLRDAARGEEVRGYGSQAAARARIDEVVAELMPGGVSAEAIGGLEGEPATLLMAVLAMASMDGVKRHPPGDMAPGERTPH